MGPGLLFKRKPDDFSYTLRLQIKVLYRSISPLEPVSRLYPNHQKDSRLGALSWTGSAISHPLMYYCTAVSHTGTRIPLVLAYRS